MTRPTTNITQTTDGYIWVGTRSGMMRFDGVKFTPWTPPKGHTLAGSPNYLLGARDGSLWIGASDGLSHLKDGELFHYTTKPESSEISSILEDHAGTIWVTRYGIEPLCRVTGTTLQCYGKGAAIPATYGPGLAEDSAGNIWYGSNILCRWAPDLSSICFEQELEHTAGHAVLAVAPGPSGTLWASLDGIGPRLGLRYYSNNKWASYVVPGFNGATVRSDSLFVDRNQSLWVGTESQGLYRIHNGVADHYGSSNGLSGNNVVCIYEDREGNVWVATDRGADMFRDTPVVTFSTNEGLIGSNIQSILALSNGSVWVGGQEALDIIHAGGISALAAGHGLPGQDVGAMFEDHTGQVWLGIDDTVMTYTQGRFFAIRKSDGSPLKHIGQPKAFAEDVEGNIWSAAFTRSDVLGQGHLLGIKDGHVEEDIRLDNIIRFACFLAPDRDAGIWIASCDGKFVRYRNGTTEAIVSLGKRENPVAIHSLFVDSDDALWLATDEGLYRWKSGSLKGMGSRNGLPCSSIYSVIEDNYGSFWLYAKCGLLKISRSDWATWLQFPEAKVSVKTFDQFDGAQPGTGNPYQPIAGKSPDGRLWFASGAFVQMIDPSRSVTNVISPPVHIEGLTADRRTYDTTGEPGLPPLKGALEISYTALSFTLPQKVRFRYKLEGHDTEWQEPGSRRQAFYNDLRPGKYKFRVIACNNDGVWNEEGATLNFSVAPAWYQTMWFRVSCVGGVVLLLWALYQLRLQQLQRQFNMSLEARVGERTRIARELHDTLLQSLHGLMFRFQAARNVLPQRPEQAMHDLDGAIARTEQAIAESRDAIQDLRSEPVAQSDLAELLTATGQELAANRDGPVLRVIVEGERRRLSPILQEEVYWIARELLRNAFQHASAHGIEAEIRYENHLFRLRVRDDGKGMAPEVLEAGGRAGHWGLPGVRERAQKLGARLDFWSEAGAGTEVQLTVPAAVAFEKPRDGAGFRLFRKARIHEHQS